MRFYPNVKNHLQHTTSTQPKHHTKAGDEENSFIQSNSMKLYELPPPRSDEIILSSHAGDAEKVFGG